jgi:acetyl-CoA C-acetyltransferase
MKNDVYILGGYQTDFARNWSKENKHISAMMYEAYEGSLSDVSINKDDVSSILVSNFLGESYCNQGMLGAFPVDFESTWNGIPTMRVEAACASGSVAVLSAMSYVMAGIYDVVCVIGVEQMKTVDAKVGSDFLGYASWYDREAKESNFPMPKLFNKLQAEYGKRYGIDKGHLANISSINYDNAKRNPNAQTRDWYMSFDHANTVGKYNTLIEGDIRTTDCSQITDGAVCVYVASEKFVRDHDLKSVSKILGWGHTTTSMEHDRKMSFSKDNEYVLPFTRKAILDSFKMAGIKNCWDLDCLEVHDCFTITEYMSIDHFGLTDPGRSFEAIEDGTIEMTGRLPINPSGGLIGCGHPVGATGVRQILDAHKQVVNKAGSYQIEGASKVATLNIGGAGTTSVSFIIGK